VNSNSPVQINFSKNFLSLELKKQPLDGRRLGENKTLQQCLCVFELDIGSVTTERVVECSFTLDRLGLISVNEVTFLYTAIKEISQYCYCSWLENKHNRKQTNLTL